MKLTEPALGKCATCSDQLLSVPGKTPGDARRVICPICVTNERDEMRSLLKDKGHRYLPTEDETGRMAL